MINRGKGVEHGVEGLLEALRPGGARLLTEAEAQAWHDWIREKIPFTGRGRVAWDDLGGCRIAPAHAAARLLYRMGALSTWNPKVIILASRQVIETRLNMALAAPLGEGDWLIAADGSFMVEYQQELVCMGRLPGPVVPPPDQLVRYEPAPAAGGAYPWLKRTGLAYGLVYETPPGLEQLNAYAFGLHRLPAFLDGTPGHATALAVSPRTGTRRVAGFQNPTPTQVRLGVSPMEQAGWRCERQPNGMILAWTGLEPGLRLEQASDLLGRRDFLTALVLSREPLAEERIPRLVAALGLTTQPRGLAEYYPGPGLVATLLAEQVGVLFRARDQHGRVGAVAYLPWKLP